MQRQFCSRDWRKEKRSRGRVSGTRGRRWSTFLPWISVLTPRLRNRCKLAPRIQCWHLDCIQVILSLRGSAVPGSCRLFTEKWKTRSSGGQSLGKTRLLKCVWLTLYFHVICFPSVHFLTCPRKSLGYFFEKDIYTHKEKKTKWYRPLQSATYVLIQGRGLRGARRSRPPVLRWGTFLSYFSFFFGIVISWSPISAESQRANFHILTAAAFNSVYFSVQTNGFDRS